MSTQQSIELTWSWEVIGAFERPPSGSPAITLRPEDIPTMELAVYRLDFCDQQDQPVDPEIEGDNCYVGETTDLNDRLSQFLGGSGSGAGMRARLIEHLERHPAGKVRISVMREPRLVIEEFDASEGALAGHFRLLFEQAAIADAAVDGSALKNIGPEERLLAASLARARARARGDSEKGDL